MSYKPIYRDPAIEFVEQYVRAHPRASVNDIAREAEKARKAIARHEISAIRKRIRLANGEPDEPDLSLLPTAGKPPDRVEAQEFPSKTEELVPPPMIDADLTPEAEASAKERVESYRSQATADAELEKEDWHRMHEKAEGPKAKQDIRVRFMRARLDEKWDRRASDLIAEMKDVFGMALDTGRVQSECREYLLTFGDENRKARLRKPGAEEVLVSGQGYRVRDPSKPEETPARGWVVRSPQLNKPQPGTKGSWTVRDAQTPEPEIPSPPQLTVVKAPEPEPVSQPESAVSFASSEEELTVASEGDRLISWREKGKDRWKVLPKEQAAQMVQELFKKGIPQDQVVIWKPTRPKVKVTVEVALDD